jgi:hypothetical protein
MSNEIEKMKRFMTIKRDTVEETINDTSSTTFAIFLIILAIVLGVTQTLLSNFLARDALEWLMTIVGEETPSAVRIVLEAIMNNIVFPILMIFLLFYIGNGIKGEAESLNHVIRAIGYSTPPLLISSAIAFLTLIDNPVVWGIVGFFMFAFGIWFAVVVIYALMITFKKGAFTAIVAVIFSAIIAGIATGWTVFIP